MFAIWLLNEREMVMLRGKIKHFFSCDRESPVEREVRRRLTWRVIMLSLSPVPLLLLLIYFIYLLAISNHESISDLHKRNMNLARRIKCLEEEIRQIQQRLNHDDAKYANRPQVEYVNVGSADISKPREAVK